jgi:alanyl-tRNA synthetase
VVSGNAKVTISFEDAATAQGLRKASARDGELRIITIDGVDRSACGGTHVRATGEIGAILLRKQDRMHGNARIEFLCGGRALRRARSDYDAITRVSGALGISVEEAAARVEILQTEFRDAERARRKLSDELAVFRAGTLYSQAAPDERGIRWVEERLPAGTLDDVRALGHATAALERAAFVGVIGDPPQILFAASADSGIDAGKSL